MADRLGSIEKGKIGNLVVTRGEIFDDRTKVEMIFVDGRKYTPAADASPWADAARRLSIPVKSGRGESMKKIPARSSDRRWRLCARRPSSFKNATIMTVSKGTFKGSIVVKDGKIAEVGEKVMVPQGATIIDAAGQYVIPGIIDCHSHIAGDGGINEGSVSVSSMVNIKDVINPEDIAIYRALAGGVTTANILHGSANSIGGKTLPLKMRWGKDAQGMIFEGATPGHQVRARRESQARRQSAPARRHRRRRAAALSRHPHGRGGRDPRGLQRGQGLQGGVGRLRGRSRQGEHPAFRRAKT